MDREDTIKIDDRDKVISVDKEGVEVTGESGSVQIKGEGAPIEIERIYYKGEGQNIFNFFKSKKGQWILVGILLLAIIIFGSWIRVQNLHLLKDQTTGEYIPLALDPFYFLRVAETIVDNGGVLPAVDSMRILKGGAGFATEILPQTIVMMWKIANIFGDYSLQHIDVLSPVIFFILGIIVFFFLIYSLTDSKRIALLSSFFLAIAPSYLYRTMAGFSDHEAIGMLSFLLTLLVYSYCLKNLVKKSESKNYLPKTVGMALIVGFLTVLTIVSWGGISKYIFMIIPFSFFVMWLLKTQDIESQTSKLDGLGLFYVFWILSSIFSSMLFKLSFSSIIQSHFLTPSGLISLFVLGFILVDYALIKNGALLLKKSKLKKYRILLSMGVVGGLVILFLPIVKGNFSIFFEIISRFLDPFGNDRLGLTVAENKQPYLNEWIGQVGKAFFWAFYFGMIFLGVNISKGIRKKKHKIFFSVLWILFVSGVIFSRISSSSLLNGDNFLSKLIYFGSFIIFGAYLLWLYFNDKLKLRSDLILILSWMIFMLISGRGAIRLFFVIAPFVYFMSGYALVNLFDFAKESQEELAKWGAYIVLGILLISLASGSMGAAKSSIQQGKYTGPSANAQWQNAMEWARENTSENAIFSHWWDYGYWVEYLGERPTIADGGHFEGTFRDHLIGRYILTNPIPESAMSFMKSNNVSYLLIDQTDIGKYPAYSSIGSNPEWDRMSMITTLVSDPKQTQETSKGETRIYGGTSGVGDDIIYEENGSTIFLPGAIFNEFGSPSYKSYMVGVVLDIEKNNKAGGSLLKQPQGAFVYEGKQVRIPLRYAYVGGEKVDFGKGLNAGIKIIPRAYSSGAGMQMDQMGAALYFGPRTIDSLVVQLFLLNDPDKRYPSVKLGHSEDHPILSDLKRQGAISGVEKFLVYQGVHGPIKIFEINYRDDILINEEFTRYSGGWGEFDELEVTK
ncbi:hypothetical protein GOV13_01255 [Candidatus Pacearchaeota archaeon]|nr:hypothetical protein [Candidatus Pacearchaeota archaeon]